MRIFNFGLPELLLILVVMIVFLGPERMVEAASKLGKAVYRITHSEVWASIWQTSREIRQMPKTIVEETGLQDSLDEINATGVELQKDMDGVQTDLNGIQLETDQELKKVEQPLATLTKNPPQTLAKDTESGTDTSPEHPAPSTLKK